MAISKDRQARIDKKRREWAKFKPIQLPTAADGNWNPATPASALAQARYQQNVASAQFDGNQPVRGARLERPTGGGMV